MTSLQHVVHIYQAVRKKNEMKHIKQLLWKRIAKGFFPLKEPLNGWSLGGARVLIKLQDNNAQEPESHGISKKGFVLQLQNIFSVIGVKKSRTGFKVAKIY